MISFLIGHTFPVGAKPDPAFGVHMDTVYKIRPDTTFRVVIPSDPAFVIFSDDQFRNTAERRAPERISLAVHGKDTVIAQAGRFGQYLNGAVFAITRLFQPV